MNNVYAIAVTIGPHPDAPDTDEYTVRGISAVPPVVHLEAGRIIGVEWIPSPGTHAQPQGELGRGRRPNTLLTEEAMRRVPWDRVQTIKVYRTHDYRGKKTAPPKRPWE